MSTEPEPPERPTRPGPTRRGAAFAAAYGVVVATIGYVVAQGNLLGAVLVMVAIGILLRILAIVIVRRRGGRRPPWWKWL
jgi:hypothetical protein